MDDHQLLSITVEPLNIRDAKENTRFAGVAMREEDGLQNEAVEDALHNCSSSSNQTSRLKTHSRHFKTTSSSMAIYSLFALSVIIETKSMESNE